MLDIVRDAPFGQLARFLTGNKVFLYHEEEKDFQCHHCYIGPKTTNPTEHPSSNGVEGSRAESTSDATVNPALDSNLEKTGDKDNLDFVPTNNSSLSHADRTSIHPSLEFRRTQTLPYTTERMEIEQELALTKTKSIPIKATETADGTVLVDWYSTDDPANPQNWSQKKKALVALQIEWVALNEIFSGASLTNPCFIVCTLGLSTVDHQSIFPANCKFRKLDMLSTPYSAN
jgi:MFS transporter, DHA1 family, multidrug resistance protein